MENLMKVSRWTLAALLCGSMLLAGTPAHGLESQEDLLTVSSVDNGYAMPCHPWSVGPVAMDTRIRLDDLTDSGNSALCAAGPSVFIGARLNVSAFTVYKGPWRHAPSSHYKITRDYSGHGGGYWKLYYRDTRVGTYKQDGWPRNAQP